MVIDFWRGLYLKKLINDFMDSQTSLHFGISLLTVPIYFYWVDKYQELFLDKITYYQSRDVWGLIGAVSFMIGLSLTIFYLDSKLEHKRLSNRFIKSVVILTFTFLSWLVIKEFAYFVFTFWVTGICLLIGVIQDVISLSIGHFLKMETNYQLMIAIPLITIVLNYLLKI